MNLNRKVALAACLVSCSTVVGCVASLKPPPTVAELAGGGSHHPAGDVDGLLEDAEAFWTGRSVRSVRRASDRWIAAAAADPRRIEGLIGCSRAQTWLAGREKGGNARERAALKAVQSAQLCAERAPDDPACTYWLAVSLGVQARERRTTALDALPKIVQLLEQAVEADPTIEHAGPHRVLALVRVRAPGWPRGPGDAEMGLQHARAAIEIDPDYPPNRLCLAEALAAMNERTASRKAYEAALELAQSWKDDGAPAAAAWFVEASEALAALSGDPTR